MIFDYDPKLSNAKFCVNCSHHVAVEKPEKNMSTHQCAHLKVREVVAGAPRNCSDARDKKKLCGVEGVLFAQRVSNPVQGC